MICKALPRLNLPSRPKSLFNGLKLARSFYNQLNLNRFSRSELIPNINPLVFYNIVTEVERYPEFISPVSKTKIIEA